MKTGVTLSTLSELTEYKHIESTRGGITTSTTTSVIESLEQSEELAEILNQRMLNRSGGNNQRLAIMLGMLTRDPKNPIKANIPSNDKSQFSQERWKFFLNADFEISNKCCSVMKKEPVHRYNKETGRMPITAQMASESRLRTQKWLENGCNAFDLKRPISNPMSFWTEQDVLLYANTYIIPQFVDAWEKVQFSTGRSRRKARKFLRKNGYRKTGIASVYGDIVVDYAGMGQLEGQMSIADYMTATEKEEFDLDRPLLKTTGCTRTGCILCGFGCHLDKGESRFERLKKTHPKAYYILDVVKNNGVTYREAIDWINENNGKGKIIRY